MRSKSLSDEKLSTLSQKVEYLSKTGADINIQKQLEDCKKLLKCQSCNHNFKSHVLLKCMHTFW